MYGGLKDCSEIIMGGGSEIITGGEGGCEWFGVLHQSIISE